MSSMKDHGLRLFGKVIQLQPKDIVFKDCNDDHDDNNNDCDCDCDYECTSSSGNSKQGKNRGNLEKSSTNEAMDKYTPQSKKGSNSTITEDTKAISNDKQCSSQDSHNKDASDQTSSSTNPIGEKTLQKPDKIIPCPRCNSMTTKFCYFNNYNVNQPRHFCKDCQRYWTAGGTTRNVPVGSGRRKSKSSRVPEACSFKAAYKPYGFENGVPCFQGLSRPYAYSQVPLQLGFPMPFCLASTPQSNLQSTVISNSPSSSSRKRSRDGTLLFFGQLDGNNMNDTIHQSSENVRVVIPKTLKVDDPIEASNSSIWSTLKTRNNHHVSPSIVKGGFFGGDQKFSKYGHNHMRSNPSAEASSLVLGFNPAAFSRSSTFNEITQ